jgi:hypothetical protein
VFALSQVAFYFAFKWIVGSLDPSKAKRQEAKTKSNKVLGKLGVSLHKLMYGAFIVTHLKCYTQVKDLKLTEYEQIIATEVIHADEIHVNFKGSYSQRTGIATSQNDELTPLLSLMTDT